MIKSEAEAAIIGKQWPLSCFGPFKEKMNIPDFIDDLSFEEIRWQCLEANNNGLFDNWVSHFRLIVILIQYFTIPLSLQQAQFNQLVMKSQRKIQSLVSMTPKMMDLFVSIYNKPLQIGNQNSTMGTHASTANPFNNFGGTSNTTTNTNSIFGGNTFDSNKQKSNSIFGTSSGGFNQTSNTNNIFSGPTMSAPATNSVFGGGNTKMSNNLFKSSSFASALPTTEASIFGQSQLQQTNSVFGESTFGGSNNLCRTNTFGTPHLQSTDAFDQSQQPQQQQSIFGSTAAQDNIFSGVRALQTQPPTQQQENPFQSVFSQPVQQSNNVFGQNVFGSQPQQFQNVFEFQMQSQQLQPKNVFGEAPINVTQSNNVFQSQNATLTIESSKSLDQILPTGNIFQTAPSNTQSKQSLFGRIPCQTQNFTVFQNVTDTIPDNFYSKMKDISEENLNAFKAESFELGKIPMVLPPRELC